jgi:hypothetical protein
MARNVSRHRCSASQPPVVLAVYQKNGFMNEPEAVPEMRQLGWLARPVLSVPVCTLGT